MVVGWRSSSEIRKTMQPEIISKYFTLSAEQQRQMEALGELYTEWNSKINVVSRKDIDELYVRHVLHSLAIAKVCTFEAGARVCDIGPVHTGK